MAPIPSCARTDTKPVDRDLQMNYDIAKNEGPLRRTVKAAVGEESSGAEERQEEQKKTAIIHDASSDQDMEERATATQYPAIERLDNVETHLAIRYGFTITTPNPRCPTQVPRGPHHPT